MAVRVTVLLDDNAEPWEVLSAIGLVRKLSGRDPAVMQSVNDQRPIVVTSLTVQAEWDMAVRADLQALW